MKRSIYLFVALFFLFSIRPILAAELNVVTFDIPPTKGNKVTINGSGGVSDVIYNYSESGQTYTHVFSSFPTTFGVSRVVSFTHFEVRTNPDRGTATNVTITIENTETGESQTFSPGNSGGGDPDPPPSDGGSVGTLNVNKTTEGDGSTTLSWGSYSGAALYQVFTDDGVLEVSGTSWNSGAYGGAAKIKALNQSGDVIAVSDTFTVSSGSGTGGGDTDPPPDDGTGGGAGGSCEGCERLAELLECPEWDDYMSDLTRAFKRAIPPPPDWDEVASTMRDKIVPALIEGMVDDVVPAMGREMDRILGHPSPPPTISTPSVPKMDGTSGVSRPTPTDSAPPAQSFDLNSIPSVAVEPDTTGGIDLSMADPIDSVPHTDDNYMPMPGKETGGAKPMQKPVDTPTPKARCTISMTTVWNGSYNYVQWQPLDGVSSYQIYVNGSLRTTVSTNSWTTTDSGTVQVKANNSDGSCESDIKQLGGSGGGGATPPADPMPTPATSTNPAPSPSAPGPDASVTPPPRPEMPMPSIPTPEGVN